MAAVGPVAVLVVAFVPELESRASVPLGMLAFHMGPLQALAWTLAGNLAGAAVAWRILPGLARLLRRSPPLSRFLDHVLAHTRKRAGPGIQRLEELSLVLFIGIPLPGTGAWAGVAAAHLFGIPGRRAFWPVAAGTVLAAVLMTLLVSTGKVAASL